ncbi:RidA family protein [Sphingomonas flavalba]|uniref:RidA family protein n=1 Tax=Sphingomonas flavalba TaxID=2559804 RepID=UPI00109E2C54|nr:RidA family protein [Sphingomonas flavalba]
MPRYLLTALLAATTASLAAGGAQAQAIERHAKPAPSLILDAVTVPAQAEMLYLSGQVATPADPAASGAARFGDTRTQTISVLNRIKAVLAARGYEMADIVRLTVYLVGDPKLGGRMDFDGMNEGFRQFFGSADNPNSVARSTVQVAALAGPEYLVEIEATAARVR